MNHSTARMQPGIQLSQPVFLQHHDSIRYRQSIVSRLVLLKIPVQVGSTESNYEFSGRIPSPIQ